MRPGIDGNLLVTAAEFKSQMPLIGVVRVLSTAFHRTICKTDAAEQAERAPVFNFDCRLGGRRSGVA